jgi:hypothetical protein
MARMYIKSDKEFTITVIAQPAKKWCKQVRSVFTSRNCDMHLQVLFGELKLNTRAVFIYLIII